MGGGGGQEETWGKCRGNVLTLVRNGAYITSGQTKENFCFLWSARVSHLVQTGIFFLHFCIFACIGKCERRDS